MPSNGGSAVGLGAHGPSLECEVADANVAAAQAIQMILMEPAKASHLALESATGSSEAVREERRWRICCES